MNIGPLPHNWTKAQVEIDNLLRSYYPDYESRVYLKPVLYLERIQEEPGKYLILSQLCTKHQKRYISTFLKQQGRVPRNNTVGAERTWMLPVEG
jgi:hypothetical protein